MGAQDFAERFERGLARAMQQLRPFEAQLGTDPWFFDRRNMGKIIIWGYKIQKIVLIWDDDGGDDDDDHDDDDDGENHINMGMEWENHQRCNGNEKKYCLDYEWIFLHGEFTHLHVCWDVNASP